MRVKIKGLEFNKRYIITFSERTRFYYEFTFPRKNPIRIKINYHDIDGKYVGDLDIRYLKKELKSFIKDDDIQIYDHESGIEHYFKRFSIKEEEVCSDYLKDQKK